MRAGWKVGKDRVERIWRREGLKVPKRQKPRGRLWLNDGSCVRLRPAHAKHVWSYDFMSARTHDGRSVRILNLIDEYTRECLLIRAERRWSSAKVIGALADVMVIKGVPEHLRSDNGPEFVAKDLRRWLTDTGAKTLYIEPGSPWENGYCESFNSKLRDEFLNPEIFYSIKELRVLAERWRMHYNTVRPHSSLGYKPPAPEAWLTNNNGWGGFALSGDFHPIVIPSSRSNSAICCTGIALVLLSGCAYRRTIWIRECPSIAAGVTRSIPDIAALVAHVWRRSYRQNGATLVSLPLDHERCSL